MTSPKTLGYCKIGSANAMYASFSCSSEIEISSNACKGNYRVLTTGQRLLQGSVGAPAVYDTGGLCEMEE